MKLHLIFLFVLGSVLAGHAASHLPPNPPSGVQAVALSASVVQITWQDNSANEDHFNIYVGIGTNGSYSLLDVVASNVTSVSYTNVLAPGGTYQFVIGATNQFGLTWSDLGSPATVTMPTLITAPTNLVVLATGPGSANLTWADTSTNEINFYVGYRPGTTGSFSLFPGGVLASNTTNFTANGLTPGLTYQFLIEAALDNFNVADSAVAAVAMPTLYAPSNLTATALNPSQIKVTWKDNSTNETKFYAAYRVGTNGAFTVPPDGELPANTTNYTFTNLSPGVAYELLVETYFDDYAAEDASVLATPQELLAPSNLTATALGSGQVKLTWRDNSTNETHYYVAYRSDTNGAYTIAAVGGLPPDTTNFTVTGLSPATAYQFLVEAYYDDYAAMDSTIFSTTLNSFTSRSFHPAVVGQPISAYTMSATTGLETPDWLGVAGLPPGLDFDGTNQITGTPTQAGVFVALMTAHYPAAGTITNPLTFRIIYPAGPPVILSNLPNQTLATNSAPVTIPLNGFFTDPDTEKAVRFVTTKGNFDVALYATAAPQTVSNFLGYVNRGDFNNSVVTRASLLGGFGPPFVVQGGGYNAAGTNFSLTSATASPTNEPGIQNARGTLAMAKQDGVPDSATDEWFVNLRDNSDQLDDQNGGFAAFARICGNGVSVADAIMALPRSSYTVSVLAGTNVIPHTFGELPVNTPGPAPATYDPALTVIVQSVTNIAPLAYSVVGNTAPGVAGATINGSNLVVTPVTQFGGSATIAVAATDLDGNSVTNAFTVQVAGAFTTWLNSFSLTGADARPDADADGDSLVNAVEFALMTSPAVSNASATVITNSFVTVSNQQYLALTFRLRKDLGGATVLLRGASALGGAWGSVWTSADLNGPLVVQKVDQGVAWLMTVRDSVPRGSAGTGRFLNLQVQTPP